MRNKTSIAEVSNRLIIVTAVFIVLAVLAVPFGFYLYPRVRKLLDKPLKKGDFLETFNDGTIDPKIKIIINGGTKYSVENGKLFFDQGTSARDAHMWYLAEPLDLSRRFVTRVRAKTGNYIASAAQGCRCMAVWATSDNTFELYDGGLWHANCVTGVSLHGGVAGFNGGRTMLHFAARANGQGINWDFADKAWVNPAKKLSFAPYPATTYITMELWSTPERFYYRMLDRNGSLLYKTAPVKWADNAKVAAGVNVYLYGGEIYTNWWSNDQWVDLIEVNYS